MGENSHRLQRREMWSTVAATLQELYSTPGRWRGIEGDRFDGFNASVAIEAQRRIAKPAESSRW